MVKTIQQYEGEVGTKWRSGNAGIGGRILKWQVGKGGGGIWQMGNAKTVEPIMAENGKIVK